MNGAVLAVDDQPAALELVRLALEKDGLSVEMAGNGVEALLRLEERPFDLVISDLEMPQMDGLELLVRVRQRWPELPFIMVTAHSDVTKVVEAVQLGAVNYLLKPALPAAVSTAVRKALQVRTTAAAPRGIPELVGASRSILEVRHLVTLAARSDVPLLISGETGTGKELVARAIHRYSAVSGGPFVPHNCAVTPRDLFESQFFGHRRGSFTGADRDHVGLLVQADSGVLFFDELEALALEHQAKLLRVLDDGEVRPVGDMKTHRVDVRFVAATNRDPRVMIDEKRLREDLYYRLRGFEISLPPLRDRREDIPLLAEHFLGADSPRITSEAMEVLIGAPWPGNIRELRNVVRSAMAMSGESAIGPRHLSVKAETGPPPPSAYDASRAVPRGTLRELERRAIIQALEDCGGNRTHAAQLLDIDRSTLRRKIREYEIDSSE